MHILALSASPRKGSNTDLLVEQVLSGAKSSGHTVESIRLYSHEIAPCIDCRACKKSDHNFSCALDDGMKEIYKSLEDADVIVFATPVYWYGPTAKMKLLIDRLRPFIASRKLQGKRGVLVIPSEEGPVCTGPLVEMFKMSFEYLGMIMAGSVLAKAYEKKEIEKSPKELERAYKFGTLL